MSDIRAALHAAIDDMPAVGWADARTTDLRWEDVHAVIDATLDAADSLDAAWAEAEAALPEGWRIHLRTVPRHSDGGLPHSTAHGYSASATHRDLTRATSGPHATPAAALRALAERLRRA